MPISSLPNTSDNLETLASNRIFFGENSAMLGLRCSNIDWQFVRSKLHLSIRICSSKLPISGFHFAVLKARYVIPALFQRTWEKLLTWVIRLQNRDLYFKLKACRAVIWGANLNFYAKFPIWRFELSLSLIFHSVLISDGYWAIMFCLFDTELISTHLFGKYDKNQNLATCSSKFKLKVAICIEQTVSQIVGTLHRNAAEFSHKNIRFDCK